jgi:hypothetical protein
MPGSDFTKTVTRVDWDAVAAEVTRRLGQNTRGRPYNAPYVHKVWAGIYPSTHVKKVVDELLGPRVTTVSSAGTFTGSPGETVTRSETTTRAYPAHRGHISHDTVSGGQS